MNRMIIFEAIREYAIALRESNTCGELGVVYDCIIAACNNGIEIMEEKGWSE